MDDITSNILMSMILRLLRWLAGNTVTLQTILSEMGNTYRGLDICAILVKRKEKPDSDWICAFLKIHFTKEEKNRVLDISQKPAKLRNGAMKNK